MGRRYEFGSVEVFEKEDAIRILVYNTMEGQSVINSKWEIIPLPKDTTINSVYSSFGIIQKETYLGVINPEGEILSPTLFDDFSSRMLRLSETV